MKKIYQEPITETYEIIIESMCCLSGGKAGGDGKPGADFDPYEDIYDGGDL